MHHLRTLGGLALNRDGKPLDGAPRKALALLAVIAANPTKGVARDRLMVLLWPESDTEHARGALKQTLHVLRQLLGSPDALLGNTELRLNPEVVTSDISAFVDAIVEGNPAEGLRHYGGPFLDGVHIESSAEFQRWAEETREDLARRRALGIEQLAQAAEAKGDHAAAARWWQTLQASDQLSGRIALKLMQAFEAAGDRAAALRHARVHAELLKQEFGVEPDGEVSAFAERLTKAPARRTASHPPSAQTPEAPAARNDVVEAPFPAAASRRVNRVAIGAVALVAIVAVVLFSRRESSSASEAGALEAKRVAVGVFENQTGDSALAPLGKMASDWVIGGLARTGLFNVLDAATLYAQADADLASREGTLGLARRNGAGLAVAGRFYRERDSLIFTASLYDVATGRVLNAIEPVGATAREPLAAVEELRQHIAAALAAAIDPRAATFLQGSDRRPPRYDAYRELVTGHEIYWRGRIDEGVAAFRRAAALDTSFLSALVWLIVGSATLDQCEAVDSLIRKLEERQEQISPAELAQVRGVRARCNRDWDHGEEHMRERSGAEPGSMIARWAVTANARRANRPAEASAILLSLDPNRDLGWMSDTGKVMYWRELAWAQHMLGDTSGQRRAVDGLRRMAPRRLATAYFASLAAIGAGRTADAVRALDGVESLPVDPAIVAGEIASRAPPNEVGTPAWVLYQIGTELLAGADNTDAVALARRAVSWLETRSQAEQARMPSRYLRVLALELEGRLDSARVVVRQLLRDEPHYIEARGQLGVLAARLGDRAEAMAADAWLARHPPTFPPGLPQFARARIAAALGERDRAMTLIETLPFRSHPVDVVFFHSDPAFASLRNEERWTRFLKPRG